MKEISSSRIYEILGDEFKNIYIVDCAVSVYMLLRKA